MLTDEKGDALGGSSVEFFCRRTQDALLAPHAPQKVFRLEKDEKQGTGWGWDRMGEE